VGGARKKEWKTESEVPEHKTISPKRRMHMNKNSKCVCGLCYYKHREQIFE